MLEYSPQESRLHTERTTATHYALPPYRKLRGYAFDPSLSLEMDTADINEVVYKIRWEDDLAIGPVGEYLEVVDYDPSSNVFYHPVDLNHAYLLAQDGLDPSESNPQFHQQMVYVVAMTTIQNVERALGRWIFWNGYRQYTDADGKTVYEDQFVQRLRLYPHAIREANAYYSPDKKAILFGYFPALYDKDLGQLPGGLVFSCLSHDIIAHEMTHAVLDGMHRRFSKDTNPDALAFHEAFSDIVALFQHFTFPEVLYNQIAGTHGDLSAQNQLGKLAHQFGQARGKRNSLRDAIGKVNKEGQWESSQPKASDYENATEVHDRGSILVAALFESFLTIYKSRIKSSIRIATNGSGKLPEGELNPDLVKRMAGEAAKTARHLLNMCIRALDYCPPVDLNFGDYLRALITADFDLVADDAHNYRLAIIGAFRKRGIYPKGIKTLSPESLRWEVVTAKKLERLSMCGDFNKLIRILKERLYQSTDIQTRQKSFSFFREIQEQIHAEVWDIGETSYFNDLTGICLTNHPIWQGQTPIFEVHSVRSSQRVTPDGDTVNQAIVVLTQRRKESFSGETPPREDSPTFWFRGGCTLIFDLTSLTLRYCISKPFLDKQRVEEQRDYLSSRTDNPGDRAMYFGKPGLTASVEATREPFAFLHR